MATRYRWPQSSRNVTALFSGGACARDAALARDAFEKFLRLTVKGEALLFGAKRVRMVITPALYEARRVLDVQHLMKDYVFDEPLRDIARVQGLTDDDGVVRGVVVAEDATRAALRPGERRLFEPAVEIATVEPLENFVKVVNKAAR